MIPARLKLSTTQIGGVLVAVTLPQPIALKDGGDVVHHAFQIDGLGPGLFPAAANVLNTNIIVKMTNGQRERVGAATAGIDAAA